MQKRLALLTTVALLLALGVAAAQPPQGGGAPPAGQGGRGGPPPAPLKLMSPDLTDGSKLAEKFGCAAGNDAVSPALQWSQPTRDSVTLVLILHDMEGHPRKGVDDILHWMVWNIPSTATGLPRGISAANYELPDGSYQTNGFVAQAPAPAGGARRRWRPGRPSRAGTASEFRLSRTLPSAECSRGAPLRLRTLRRGYEAGPTGERYARRHNEGDGRPCHRACVPRGPLQPLGFSSLAIRVGEPRLRTTSI